MKYLFTLLLFLLVSCKVVEQVEKEKIAVTIDRIWLEHNQTVTVNKTVIVHVLFSQAHSKNLKPKIYVVRDSDTVITHTGRAHPQNQNIQIVLPNTNYEWLIQFRRPGTVTILFIWEGKNVVGEKKLIHFKSI